jgi:alkylhydroperoxidase family enzyme
MVLRHQVRILERQLNVCVAYRPADSGDPRRPLAVAGAMALALLPRHARDAPLLAPRAREAQMAVLAIHSWPWSAAHVR